MHITLSHTPAADPMKCDLHVEWTLEHGETVPDLWNVHLHRGLWVNEGPDVCLNRERTMFTFNDVDKAGLYYVSVNNSVSDHYTPLTAQPDGVKHMSDAQVITLSHNELNRDYGFITIEWLSHTEPDHWNVQLFRSYTNGPFSWERVAWAKALPVRDRSVKFTGLELNAYYQASVNGVLSNVYYPPQIIPSAAPASPAQPAEWAMKAAMQRCGPMQALIPTERKILTELAIMIERHEPAPIDPVLKRAREIAEHHNAACDWSGHDDSNNYVLAAIMQALREDTLTNA